MTNDFTLNRRHFLYTGAAGAGLAATSAFAQGKPIALVRDPADKVAAAPPVKIALRELEQALTKAGFTVQHHARAPKGTFSIIMAGGDTAAAKPLLASANAPAPVAAESLVLLAAPDCVLACGADGRGLAYGIYELADRVRHAPQTAFAFAKPVAERPANPVRSIMRQFVSEQYDKPWFYDRDMWPRYFAMLAAARFNRFDLAFGLGYDMLRDVADSYFLFLYPFLVAVPGYDVRATGVSNAERDRNLKTLRYISEQAVAAGIDFELGIWTHGYVWTDSPHAQNRIVGLDHANQAAYCRDALNLLLRELPCVTSLSLRTHGESGVPEGSYGFWKTVFDGVKGVGRKVELDLHAKGITKTMIADALATGMPVNLAPKFSAEHLGLPYQQAAIRELEMPVPGVKGKGLMTLSEGSRSFTRYSYADLMKTDRPYTIRFRVFSGTQRILMSADPLTGAAYGRAFQFCGATGADLMEPLTCRGRRGSASSTPRGGYIAARLRPHWDWQKYRLWYRSFGRLMYNPGTDEQVFARPFGAEPRAKALRFGLAHASRILPLVTSAHLASAACDVYWPEIYWNQSMVTVPDPNPYRDTPTPRIFQNVSPLDPQIFSSIADSADDLLAGRGDAKYSTIEVASRLEDMAAGTRRALARAGAAQSVDFLRLAIDSHMQAGLGAFFAAKFRAGVLCALFDQTGDHAALLTALKLYHRTRGYWAGVTARAHGVYGPDLSVSDRFSERGQWADRLTGIDADIAALQKRLAGAANSHHPGITAARAAALAHLPVRTQTARHTPPGVFHAGAAVALSIVPDRKLSSARLYYRHVDQGEHYVQAPMLVRAGAYHAEIPAAYTQSAYPLQYYFELRGDTKNAWLYPGLGAQLLQQPYFVLQKV